jgi:DNA-binding transcriptional LysR family regulator
MPQTRIRRYLRHGMMPQLAVFEAVARLGSFTRAADELFMAQPTVSIQIKKLTETLGVQLIEMTGKKLRLTAAGRELAVTCSDIFRRFSALDDRLTSLRELGHGALRLAVSSAAKYFVPHLLGAFCQRHPSIEVSMHVDNARGIRSRIPELMDDLYVLSSLPENADLVAHAILPNPVEIVARADHPLAGMRAMSFAQLAGEPFILREPGSATRHIALEYCMRHGVTPRVRLELACNEAIKQAVLAGLGIAFLPRAVIGAHDGNSMLCTLDVNGLPLEREWYVAHARACALSPVASAFLDFVRANVGHRVQPYHESGPAAQAPSTATGPAKQTTRSRLQST